MTLLALLLTAITPWADEPGLDQPRPQQHREDETTSPSHGPTAGPTAATPNEARVRATLLHETIRGTLQVMHRDFFDEDDAHAIPSASLEDVFHELREAHDVEVKWLVVNTDVVNVDHRPADQFERDAAKALADGRSSFESKPHDASTANNRYRFAGPIQLHSQCLKCHVKRRTSNESRVAGLLISMPVSMPDL